MSILLGSDVIESGISRFSRLLQNCFFAGLLLLFLVGGSKGYFFYNGLKSNQQHILTSFAARKLGIKWGTSPFVDPQNLLSTEQANRGMRVKLDPKKLDMIVISYFNKFLKPQLIEVAWFACGGFSFGFLAFFVYSLRVGGKNREETKRGANMVAPNELAIRARKKGKPEFRLANININDDFFYRNVMIFGSPGAGKSQLIYSLLDQIRERGERALIFDPGGEFCSVSARKSDILLNPFDARSRDWDVSNEITNLWDAESIANSLIQNSNGGNDFFYDGARIVLAEFLKQFGKSLTMPQMFQRLAMSSAKDLHATLSATPAAPFLDPAAKGQAAGIQSTLNSKLSSWQYFKSSKNPFSIREWVRKPSTNFLFLTGREDASAALKPLLSLWIELAVTELLCRKSNEGERIWLVIDELASLQKLPALLKILSMGRKCRVAVVLATQTPSQIAEIYENMSQLLGCVGNRIVYRLEEFHDADAASKFFGEAEIEVEKESRNMGERQQGTNLNKAIERRAIIMPSEIQAMPDLTCYLKLAGGLPATKTKQKYKERIRICEPFVAAKFKPKTKAPSPTPVDFEAVEIKSDSDSNKSYLGSL